MEAIINSMRQGLQASDRKENSFYEQYTGLAVGTSPEKPVTEAVILRLYRTSSRVYACVWLCGNGLWQNGSAYAGGGGYHRASAAASEALQNAGVSLSESIDGRGDSAIEAAVKAVTLALYPEGIAYTLHAHA